MLFFYKNKLHTFFLTQISLFFLSISIFSLNKHAQDAILTTHDFTGISRGIIEQPYTNFPFEVSLVDLEKLSNITILLKKGKTTPLANRRCWYLRNIFFSSFGNARATIIYRVILPKNYSELQEQTIHYKETGNMLNNNIKFLQKTFFS